MQTGFGHEYHILKQEKMSILCVWKHLICELYMKELCACMMVLRHILAVVWEMISTIPIMTDEDPVHGLCARLVWILWILTCRDSKRPLYMRLLLTTKRQFTIALWTPVVRLSSNWFCIFERTVIHDESCQGVHWISSRASWTLIVNILFQ
jgi:hypothetical protein